MTARQTSKVIDNDTIEMLWEQFSRDQHTGEPLIALEDLATIAEKLGAGLNEAELHHLFADCNSPNGLGKGAFVGLIASLFGDTHARLTAAFDLFDTDGDGRITIDELYGVLAEFGVRRTDLEKLIAEADQEGVGTIGFSEFCALMPERNEPPHNRYRDSLFPRIVSAQNGGPVSKPGIADHITKPSGHRAEPGHGTSQLQMQIGLFRLLQGAAYRCFRENCAANYETHLRAKALPYTITHFVEFVDKAIDLYKALGIVEPACHSVLDALPLSLKEEYIRLERRIANWDTITKTPQMLEAANTMAIARNRSETVRHVFAAAIECALLLRRKNLECADLAAGLLDTTEVDRLRKLDLSGQIDPMRQSERAESEPYLETWNRVIVQSVDEEIDGAMMPAAYWYEDFMPKLLAACSVSSVHDIRSNTEPDETALDQWFKAASDDREFQPYGDDVASCFAQCEPVAKLEIYQAWRLTRHYLNGVQKRRERLEFGRETGFLSEYVAFLDIYLGRSDVQNAEMRLSFPYYIGPATWRFLHTAAEIICTREEAEQEQLVILFKDFLRLFATTYPCPYCRYHFNRYVISNRELNYYPLEYLILGSHPENGTIIVSMEDKIDAVRDGRSLRLFLWKLHNAVSSSITRTEPWYRREENPYYTSRFWPSILAESSRAQALGLGELTPRKREKITALDGPECRLLVLREQVKKSPDDVSLVNLVAEAEAVASELEAAVSAGKFLETAYSFDPALEDDLPHFTAEEEAFGRGGKFVES